MAKAKRYSPEQIVTKLRQTRKDAGRGPDDRPGLQAARDLRPDLLPLAAQIRRDEGGRGPAAQGPRGRERAPEADRRRAGPRHLGAQGPEQRENGEPGPPARCGRATSVRRSRSPERRACQLSASTARPSATSPVSPEAEQRLVKRMNELAQPPSPLRLPADLGALARRGLRGQPQADREALAPRGPPRPAPASKASGKQSPGQHPERLLATWPPERRNQIWSYDFLSHLHPPTAAFIRVLNVVDEYTRLALGCRVARSIGARDVIAELDSLFARHGKPRILRSDNGREFVGRLADRVARRARRPAGLHRARQPAAEPLRRALQRHHARRGAARRGVRVGARGPGRPDGLARGVQRAPPPPRPPHAHTTKVC